MTYAEKLRLPQWQKKRLEILNRDNWSCQSCGCTDRNLQVHHIIYARRDPWDYPDHVFQTLCEQCHRERGEMVDYLVDSIRLSLAKVPTDRLQKVSQSIMEEAMHRIP